MVDGEKLGDVGFKKLGTPYSEMDCQAFVEWCLRQCGCNKDLAGSNAWYREVYHNGAVMTPEECVKQLGKVPKGAFLFILEHDGGEPAKYKPDGLGNASHIGIVTMPRGEGAIHSSASRGCVAESKFKGKTIKNGGWNMVGLWNEVCYDYTGGGGVDPDPDPDPEPTPTPTPTPTPVTETAIVGNVPEGNRQDVNFRTRPNTNAALIERIPCGETVEVLSEDGEWAKIRWHGQTGYMMEKFLIFDETEPEPWEPGETLYFVTIHDLPKELAEEIAGTYGGSIKEEGG